MATSFPNGFLWGTATAAHQIEGGNWNTDWWAFEHDPTSGCVEPSGDACDSWHRFAEDIAIVKSLGLGAYRFSIEWARIEPAEGEFSRAALEHYRTVCATCLEHEIKPVVTFHHFTTPRWMADQGGWANEVVVDRFARYCERATSHLGDLIAMGCTINEPNIVALMGYMMQEFPPGRRDYRTYVAVNENLKAAHRAGYTAIKSGAGEFPLGLTLAMSDWWVPEGADEVLERSRYSHEGQYLEAARGDDFVGVQPYMRTRLDAYGMPLGPEEGVRAVESMGYEFWPDAAEVAIRYAVEVAQTPVYVTENGIGTHDDAERIEYMGAALAGVHRCIADGLDVRGYFLWSLLDNFEWAAGYDPQFGIVEVDRTTFVRTPKPSAYWFADVARANAISGSA